MLPFLPFLIIVFSLFTDSTSLRACPELAEGAGFLPFYVLLGSGTIVYPASIIKKIYRDIYNKGSIMEAKPGIILTRILARHRNVI